MALVKMSEKSPSSSLVVYGKSPPKTTLIHSRKILDEETYTEEMEKIITRDFFPHVTKLKTQIEYVEALRSGDMAKLNEIQRVYKPKTILSQCGSSLRNPYTPSSFGTPEVFPGSTPKCDGEETDDESSVNLPEPVISYNNVLNQFDKKGKSLDEFLASATSEDNASFEEIREKDAILHQQKYPWLYKNEGAEGEKVKKMLALPSADETKSIDIAKGAPVTWTYKNLNALMYVPDGVEYTAEEKLQLEKVQEVLYSNTRFAAPPFDEKANKEAIAEAASYQAKMKEGKVGIDGKEIVNDDSPKINGYGFIGTPSPAPGFSETPVMTWGEIEGTPFRLDGSDTPLPQNPGGQQFKMPEIPARERIALFLADKVAKKKRQKKKDALKHAQSSLLSPRFGSSSPLTSTERINLSPAAQKFMSGIHRPQDKALRASYTPSPTRTPQRERMPDITQSPQISKTPIESPYKRTKISLSAENLTQLPRRQRAQDFF